MTRTVGYPASLGKWEISSDGSNGWAAITGGTTASYTPVSGDVGKFLRVTASYSDGEGNQQDCAGGGAQRGAGCAGDQRCA